MTWLGVVVIVILVGIAANTVLTWRNDARHQQLYDTKVGLGLEQLVALLPAHLQDRNYTRTMLAPPHIHPLAIALIYEESPPRMFRGNPPNVGIEFDAETGALFAIHEAGIALGLK